jgi:carbon monoxide dehydrogenase subunit G
MNITGTSTLAADRVTVWRALNDPAVLVATIPGCQRLEALGADEYAMTVAAGVGSIKGVYDGRVSLSEQQEPGSFTMTAQGAGAAGTIGATVSVTLVEHPDGGTELTYEADAVVGGMIGGVGQRMLTGVSKKMAGQFFAAVDAHLAAGGPVVPPAAVLPEGAAASNHPSLASSLGGPVPSTAAATPSDRPAAPAAGSSAAGRVFTAPQAGGDNRGFALGVAVGAAAALAGALVGGWIAGRRG